VAAAKEKDGQEKEVSGDETFDQFDDEDDLQYGATASGRKRLFSKELRCMMFGFGDDQNPYTESVDLLEDLVIEYITDMVRYVFIIKVVINSKTMKNNLDFKLEMLRRTSN